MTPLLSITAAVVAFEIYRERQREEGREREQRQKQQRSSEMFFMWKLHQDLTTKRAPCHLQLLYTAELIPSHSRAQQERQTEKTQPLQRALLGLDQGDRHFRDPALVTHLLPQIRVFC